MATIEYMKDGSPIIRKDRQQKKAVAKALGIRSGKSLRRTYKATMRQQRAVEAAQGATGIGVTD